MGRNLWVQVDGVAKESVPAILNKVAIVGKACMMDDINILDFMAPAHFKNTSPAAHVESLQMILVGFRRDPCLGRIEEYRIGTISVMAKCC